MAVSFKLSIFSYFRFLFCLPALYILIAIGIGETGKYKKFFLCFVLGINVLCTMYYVLTPEFHREDWRGLVSFVESQKTKDSATLFVADSNMEAYKYYDPSANISGPEGFGTKYKEIWLMRYLQPVFDAKDLLRVKIEASGYNKEKEYDFNGVVVWKYEK